MSSLRRQNTLYGFHTSLPSAGFNDVSTVSGGIRNQSPINNHHHHEQNHHAECSIKPSRSPDTRKSRIEATLDKGYVFENKTRCKSCGYQIRRQHDMKLRKLLLLGLAFILYVSVGAVVFTTLESGPEHDRKRNLEIYIDDFLRNHSCVNRSEIIDLMNKAVEDSEIVYYVAHNKKNLDRWDFSGAFGFVVSVVTTIGFGNLAPYTQEGKVVCVLYSIFGIPLTLLVLRAIGQKMAVSYIKIRKIRCSFCHRFPMINKRVNVIIVTAVGFIIMFMVPAAVFSYVEQWYFLEALYFCFTTLSTVGFGDYVIGIHEEKLTSSLAHKVYIIVGYIWILVGLSYLSLIYRVIMDTAVASARTVRQKTKEKLVSENSRRNPGGASPRRDPPSQYLDSLDAGGARALPVGNEILATADQEPT